MRRPYRSRVRGPAGRRRVKSLFHQAAVRNRRAAKQKAANERRAIESDKLYEALGLTLLTHNEVQRKLFWAFGYLTLAVILAGAAGIYELNRQVKKTRALERQLTECLQPSTS